MRLFRLWIAFAPLAAFGQTASYPSAVVTDSQLRVAANNVQTTLQNPMLSTDTTATVANAAGIVANSVITIDNEEMAVCGVSGNVLTLGRSACPNADGRGFDSTAAAAHAANAAVALNIDAWHHNAVRAEVEAIENALGANLANVTIPNPLPVNKGGTGAATASGARSNLSAAASGPNSDITSLSGLTTALSAAQGGTGVTAAQGTGDTKVELAGTNSGTAGAALCNDANGGATTSGCLNYTPAYTGAATRSYAAKLADAVSALDFTGSDIGAQINAAISALGAGCGKILIPAGSYAFSTPINADGTIGCQIIGAAGITGGAQAAVKLTYTGTATPISARSSTAFQLQDIQLVTNNAAYAATDVDLSHGTQATDSVFGLIERCSFFSSNGGRAAIVIDLDKAIVTRVSDNNLQNYSVGVRGANGTSSYSNVNTLTNNHFSSSTGTAVTAHIQNPGQSWLIHGNTFEMGTAAGAPNVINCTSGSQPAIGISFVANWIGDWTNGATGGTNIQVCGGGWTIAANEIAGPFTGSVTAISVFNAVAGLQVAGNKFDLTNGTVFSFGTNDQDVYIGANLYGTPTTFMSGTPASGTVVDNTYKTTIYGTVSATVPAVVGQVNLTTSTGLPAAVGGSGPFLMGGFNSPTNGRLYIGDGTGYQFEFAKRTGSTDTTLGKVLDSGWIDMLNGFKTNGTAGYSGTVTCTAGQHVNSITISGGIITAAPTCN